MIPRIFEGQAVFVVAGGPSLLGFDFERLADRRVIAINRAHELLPSADVLWWSDARFWRQHSAALLWHAAPFKATGHTNYQPDELPHCVTTYQFTGRDGFDERTDSLRHGNNSAYAAMHLAIHLGAARIVLLGVDMKLGAGGRSHFHDGHGLPLSDHTLGELMLPYFATLVPVLEERSISVLNGSPESALTVWPRCTIEEALA